MSSAVTFKLTTGATTNLTRISSGSQAANLKYVICTNTAAYQLYIKLYWDKGLGIPTVGTTVPDIVITCPALGANNPGTNVPIDAGVTGSGALWCWITKNAVVTDATVTVAGDGIIAFLIE